MANKSGIHINPKNKGKFNALKKRTGKTTEELTHSKNPLTRKRAVFAQNAKKFKHENGGELDIYYMGGINPAQIIQDELAYNDENASPDPLYNFSQDNLYYQAPKLQPVSIANNPMQDSGSKWKVLNTPRIPINSANPYFNSAIGHFNNALNYGMKGLQKAKFGQEVQLNPSNGNMNWNDPFNTGYSNKPITPAAPYENTIQMTSSPFDFQDNYQNNDAPNLKPLKNFISAGSEGVLGSINFGKGVIDTLGTQLENQRTRQLEATQRKQAIFNQAQNQPPYENKGYNWAGRNNAIMADGGVADFQKEWKNKYGLVPKKGTNQQGVMFTNDRKGNEVYQSSFGLERYKQDVPDLKTWNNIDVIEPNQLQYLNNPKIPNVQFHPDMFHVDYPNQMQQGIDTRYYNKDGTPVFADGGLSIKEIGGNGTPSIEVEGRENITTPQGYSENINGPSHAEGGIPLNLPDGTIIFSEKLKDPLTGKSYAKMAKKFETKKDFDTLNSTYVDNIGENTAKLNIKFKNDKLQSLFAIQEANKLIGEHGEDVAKEAKSKFKFVSGGGVSDLQKKNNEMGSDALGTGDLPNKFPKWDYYYNQLKEITGKDYNKLPHKEYQNDIVKYMPDKLTDAIRSGQMGLTNTGRNILQKAGVKNYKNISNFNQLTNEDRAKLTKYGYNDLDKFLTDQYVDNLRGHRGLDISEQIPAVKITPKGEIKKEEIVTNNPTVINRTQQNNLSIPNGIGMTLPNAYVKDPIYMSQVNPQFIDPRYLDINPQLNEISRGKSAVLNTLGDRGTNSIGTALQTQINAYNQNQQAFNTKYNYDKQQDAAVQQFNAESKMNTDRVNLGEQNKFYDNIAKRQAAIENQKINDVQAGIENAAKERAYNLSKDYIDTTFHPSKYMTSDEFLANAYQNIGMPNYKTPDSTTVVDKQGTKDDYTRKTYKGQNGGKIKIKPKIKKLT
jgi:hypothetical protein